MIQNNLMNHNIIDKNQIIAFNLDIRKINVDFKINEKVINIITENYFK